MKTTLIIAMALISLAGQAQGVVYNSIGFQYTPFIQAVCTELEISADIYVVPTDKPVNGFVTKNGFGGYIIFVNNTSEADESIKLIIAHELLHISDDIKGVWDIDTPTTIVANSITRYTSDNARALELRVKKESKKLYWKFRNL